MGKAIILQAREDDEYYYFTVLVDDVEGMTPPAIKPDWTLESRFGKAPPMKDAVEGEKAPTERMSDEEYRAIIQDELRAAADALAAKLRGPVAGTSPFKL